jgi:hypothetical protein
MILDFKDKLKITIYTVVGDEVDSIEIWKVTKQSLERTKIK